MQALEVRKYSRFKIEERKEEAKAREEFSDSEGEEEHLKAGGVFD